ncbi:WD repeat-containing protein 44 isoform X1 [Musca domestica]|uniref:WD repeat-containing protein 44 n=1 Tax=Musca domestica TaxID=7370 RepID=T1PCF0_MUSDO|nr:WD repeat-containing protein 44 isoform X1 [Musca domestica]
MSRPSTDSDSSEEFFDAEDSTPNRLSTLSRKSIIDATQTPQEFIYPDPAVRVQASSDSDATPIGAVTPATSSPSSSLSARGNKQEVFVEPKPVQATYGRQRFDELRQCMQNDEDDNPGNTLTPDSQNSSTDGVFANRPTHPFKVVEKDAMSVQSMTSLGRVGRILAGSIDPSSMSIDREYFANTSSSQQQQQLQQQIAQQQQRLQQTQLTHSGSSSTISSIKSASVPPGPIEASSSRASVPSNAATTSMSETVTSAFDKPVTLQEPDVIASTKLAHSKTTDSITSSGPIAPPRRKKKSKKGSSSSSEHFNMNEGMRLQAPDTDTDSDTRSVKSVRDVQQRLRDDLVKEIEKSWNETSSLQNSMSGGSCSGASGALSAGTGGGNGITTSATMPMTLGGLSALGGNVSSACSSGNVSSNTVVSASGTSLSQISTCNARPVTTAAIGGSINRISHSLGNSSTSVYSKPSPSNSSKSNSAPGRVSSIDPSQSLNIYKATQGGYVVKPRDDQSNKAEGPTQEEIERIERIFNDNTPRPKLGTGSNSLGSATRYPSLVYRSSGDKERRKSAGDEDVLKQMNIDVRIRTNSGKQLSDIEILEQVPVTNLETGVTIPLSEVKPPPVPEGWNPLSLHILKLTSHLEVTQKESDDESVIGIPPSSEGQPQEEDEGEAEDGSRLKKKTAKIKRFFGSTMRKTVDKAKSLASEVSHARHKEDVADIVDVMNPEQNIKIKASSTNKGPYEFTKLQHVQDLSGEHTGAVWCMKFSSCGRLLATAGQDKVLRIWVLKDAYPFFQDMRTKYNADQKSSPTPSQESLVSQQSAEDAIAMATAAEKCTGPFMPKSFCTYNGHTSDLLDVSWSKNYFILSSSMDKTVRLWHISRKECLCCFQHIDFVTAIAFHPRDDRYFLSGSLDGKLRLWNIPDKKVALWNEVDGQTKLITAANFCQNGQFAVVGSYDGRCIFYNTDQLKYHTQIHVRSTRGKNRIGRKISGIEPMPGEDKILVTSNDSRVRLYDLRDLNLSCKYKGYLNASSQIKASFSHDGKYIIAGSENQCIYIWKTNHDYSKLSSVRRDRSDFWEGIKAHNATVTCAIFAPHPEAIIKPEPDEISNEKQTNNQPDPLVEQHKKGCGYVMISADFNGAIKVFINKTKPKHSSLPYTAIAD